MVFNSSDLAELAAMKKDCAALKEHNDEEVDQHCHKRTQKLSHLPLKPLSLESAAGPDIVGTA
eukprot:scaffold101253_cov55-Attheya_sp.AAC.1